MGLIFSIIRASPKQESLSQAPHDHWKYRLSGLCRQSHNKHHGSPPRILTIIERRHFLATASEYIKFVRANIYNLGLVYSVHPSRISKEAKHVLRFMQIFSCREWRQRHEDLSSGEL